MNDPEKIKTLLIKNSPVSNRTHLKKQLIKHGYLKDECLWCGMKPEWRGEKMTLEMDHINGDNTDNRLENLRILCLHCHSQTPTFRRPKTTGKNNKMQRRKIIVGIAAGLLILYLLGFFTLV